MPDFKFMHAGMYGFVLLLSSLVIGIESASAAPSTQTEIGPETSTLRPEFATVSKPEFASGIQSLEWRSDPSTPGEEAVPAIVSDEDVWQRIRSGFRLSDTQNPLTSTHENWYARHPDYVKRMVLRSRRYLFHIATEVERRGMPMEIALLPMIESAFNSKAYSTAAASGIWQFIPSTGKHYGLKQNHWYDGRRDFTAATNAALDYLTKLYRDFGDWQLALAAYNCGEGCVGRAIKKNIQLGLPTDYVSLPLPTETRHYVPKLLAIKNLVLDPMRFGVALDVLPNQPYFAQVELNTSMDVRSAARLAGMELDDFITLNPAFSRNLIRSDTPINILVPVDKTDHFQHGLRNGTWDTWTPYYARKGERLEALATRFDTSVARLKEHNSFTLKRGKLARAQTILIPVKGRGALASTTVADLPKALETVPSADSNLHTVTAGETLFSIARRHNITVKALQLANPEITPSVQTGQILLLPVKAKGASALGEADALDSPLKKVALVQKIRGQNQPRYYTIKRGDTLSAVARLFDVELSELKSLNPTLSPSRGIQTGERIVVGLN